MIRIVRPGRFIFFLVILIVVIVGLGFGAFRVIIGSSTVARSAEFTINEGSPAVVIWQQLVEAGFTSRITPWQYYAWRLEAAGSLKSGSYQLQAGEDVRRVIQRFVAGDASPDELAITYPEGFTLEQIAARTAARGIGSADSFIKAANPSAFTDAWPFLADIPPTRDLEGYLFPDTYRVFPDDQPADVITRMLANFDDKFSASLRQEAAAQGRSLDEIVIMASIIEREVVSDDDMATVAGVLWNRYNDDFGLAADATVRFALDKWDKPLTVKDLTVDSAYNTRRYKGLPPGPISNPGLRALTAAVRPAKTDFYYYLSTPDGETIFSKTLDEHNANKAKYLR